MLTYWLMFLAPAWASVAAPSMPRPAGKRVELSWLLVGVFYAVVLFVWLNFAVNARYWLPYQSWLFQ